MPNNANIPTITNPVLAGLVLALRRAGISYASNGFRHYGCTHRTGSVNFRTVKMLAEIGKGNRVSTTLTNAQVLGFYITAASIEKDCLKAEHQSLPLSSSLEASEGLKMANRKLKLLHRQWDCETVINILSELMKLDNQS